MSNGGFCRTWETYPASLDVQMLIRLDVDSHCKRVVEDSGRLFAQDRDELESIRLPRSKRDVEISRMRDASSLPQFLEANNTNIQECLYIIRQENSWGRFHITLDTFQKLLIHENIFPAFMDCVHAFGFKIDEDEKVWDGLHIYTPTTGRDCERLELCYNIRYVAKHGRDSQNHWSLRQTGVYHRVDRQTGKSTWILLQPSQRLAERLQKAMPYKAIDVKQHTLLLHILVLSSMSESWDEFIGDLRSELAQLDDKACFSRVAVKKRHDYKVTFADMQRVQLFRQKVLRISSVLDSCLAVASGCERLCQRIVAIEDTTASEIMFAGLRAYEEDIKRHRRSIAALLEYSSLTVSLLSKVLECRNGEVVLKAHHEIEKSLLALNQITKQGAEIAERAQADSKALKALTLIATMYLPATLLATLFSSNLVQLRSSGDGDDTGTYFVVVTQFWLYIILTTVLSLITALAKFVLERRSIRENRA